MGDFAMKTSLHSSSGYTATGNCSSHPTLRDEAAKNGATSVVALGVGDTSRLLHGYGLLCCVHISVRVPQLEDEVMASRT